MLRPHPFYLFIFYRLRLPRLQFVEDLISSLSFLARRSHLYAQVLDDGRNAMYGPAQSEHLWTRTLLKRSQGQPITFRLFVTAAVRRNEVKNIIHSHVGHIRQLFIQTASEVPPTTVWGELQLFMSQNFYSFDYHRQNGMHITAVRNSSVPLSNAKSYPVHLPLISK